MDFPANVAFPSSGNREKLGPLILECRGVSFHLFPPFSLSSQRLITRDRRRYYVIILSRSVSFEQRETQLLSAENRTTTKKLSFSRIPKFGRTTTCSRKQTKCLAQLQSSTRNVPWLTRNTASSFPTSEKSYTLYFRAKCGALSLSLSVLKSSSSRLINQWKASRVLDSPSSSLWFISLTRKFATLSGSDCHRLRCKLLRVDCFQVADLCLDRVPFGSDGDSRTFQDTWIAIHPSAQIRAYATL